MLTPWFGTRRVCSGLTGGRASINVARQSGLTVHSDEDFSITTGDGEWRVQIGGSLGVM